MLNRNNANTSKWKLAPNTVHWYRLILYIVHIHMMWLDMCTDGVWFSIVNYCPSPSIWKNINLIRKLIYFRSWYKVPHLMCFMWWHWWSNKIFSSLNRNQLNTQVDWMKFELIRSRNQTFMRPSSNFGSETFSLYSRKLSKAVSLYSQLLTSKVRHLEISNIITLFTMKTHQRSEVITDI